ISAVELKQKTKELGSTQEATYAIVKEQLKTMGQYTENAATNVDQLNSSWKNLGITVSKYFESGGIPKFLRSYVDALNLLIESQQKGISVEETLRQRRVEENAIIGVNLITQQEFNGEREHDLQVTKDIITEKTHELIQQQEEIKNLKDTQRQRILDIHAQEISFDEKKKRIAQLIEEPKQLKIANQL